jgi:hypothetical protein
MAVPPKAPAMALRIVRPAGIPCLRRTTRCPIAPTISPTTIADTMGK